MLITKFQQQVYNLTARIPKGRISTYQAIASALKKSGASRAVGNALHKNPYAPKVPCHRVIKSDGRLGGYAGGSAKKKALLKKEGISITGDKIDLKKYGYRFKTKK
jgi:methylated-DNA-[protein]-cysteine S-methyltransferase